MGCIWVKPMPSFSRLTAICQLGKRRTDYDDAVCAGFTLECHRSVTHNQPPPADLARFKMYIRLYLEPGTCVLSFEKHYPLKRIFCGFVSVMTWRKENYG